MKKAVQFTVFAIIFSFLLSACYTTRISNEWTNPNYKQQKLEKVAVVAILKMGETRKAMEHYMAEYLKRGGLNAVAAYTLIQDTAQQDKEQMEKIFNAAGVDAVLTMRKIAIDEQANYVAPTVYPYPRVYYNNFYNYYYNSWGAFATPGYVRIDKTFRIENNLYEASNDEVIWTAVSNTMNPDSEMNLAESISTQIIRRLKKNGMLK